MGYYSDREHRRHYRSILWIFSAVLIFIAFILHIVGFSTDYWVNLSGLVHSGLWRGCVTVTSATTCTNIGDGAAGRNILKIER